MDRINGAFQKEKDMMVNTIKLNVYSTIAVFTVLIIMAILTGPKLAVLISYGGALLIATSSLLYFKITKDLARTKNFIVASAFFWISYAIITSAISGGELFFLFVFPAVVFFLIGSKNGLIWTMLMLLVLMITFLGKYSGLLTNNYNRIWLIYSALSLMLVSLISYRNTKMREAYQEELERIIDENYSFRLGIDKANNHIIITDTNGIVIYANRAATKTTGFTQNEIVGNTPRLWGGMMSRDAYQKLWHTIKIERKPYRAEVTNRRKNGELYTALLTVSPVVDDANTLIGFIGNEADISMHINLETKLRQQTERAEAGHAQDEVILNNISEGIMLVDPHGKVTRVNNQLLKMMRMNIEEFMSKDPVDVVKVRSLDGQPIPDDERVTRVALRTHKPHQYRCVVTRKDGTDIVVDSSSAPLLVGDKLVGVIVMTRDVTKEQAIDQAKTEFVSLASHQLRTPLSAINWYSEMLLTGDVGGLTPDQKTYLEEIYQGNKRMTELVNALLNVSRIDTGTFVVEPVEVKITELVKNVSHELKHEIDEKKIKYSEMLHAIPVIQADPKLLRIIVQNLLTNAIKYTPEGGNVTMKLAHNLEKDIVELEVADTGYGIPKDGQDRIFSKLFRAENVQKMDVDGNGLGLYIVRSIIDHVGGKIRFKSEENKGTTFYVELPMKGMTKKEGTRQLG